MASPDCFSGIIRSKVMRSVKSRGNKTTEGRLSVLFRTSGVKGWRRNQNVYGKPDFTFRNEKIAVFADGCFWHGHDCRNTRPKANAQFWKEKIRDNRMRDKNVNGYLRESGWKVIRFWECEINSPKYGRKLRKLKKLFECGSLGD